ncbi:MAG: hypothetical protein VX730_06975 [Pseudomonadota bacterium]|nr:hypothetical protein [Pseudomonadota bacterium]
MKRTILAMATIAATALSTSAFAQATDADVEATNTCRGLAIAIDSAIGNLGIGNAAIFLGWYAEQECSPQELADILEQGPIPELCEELAEQAILTQEDMDADPTLAEGGEIFLEFLENGQKALQCPATE